MHATSCHTKTLLYIFKLSAYKLLTVMFSNVNLHGYLFFLLKIVQKTETQVGIWKAKPEEWSGGMRRGQVDD